MTPARLRLNVLTRAVAEIAIGFRGLILLPIVVPVVGGDGYGILTQAWLTVSIAVPMFSLSLEHAMVRSVAGSASLSERRVAIWTGLCVAAFLGIGTVSVSGVLPSGQLSAVIFGQDEWRQPARLAAVLIGIGIPMTVAQSVFQGEGRILVASALQLARAGASLVAMSCAAYFARTTAAILTSAVMAEASVLGLTAWAIHRRTPMSMPRMSLARDMCKFGAPLAASNGLFGLLAGMPRFVLIHYWGPSTAGAYAASTALIAAATQLVSPIQFVIYPEAARLWGANLRDRSQQLISLSANVFLMVSIPAVWVLVVLSQPLLNALSRNQLGTSPGLVGIIGFAGLGVGVFRLAGTVLLVDGRSGRFLAILTIASAGCTLAALVLVPAHGQLGAAVAYAVGALCASVGVMHEWSRRYAGSGYSEFRRCAPDLLLAALVPATAAVVVSPLQMGIAIVPATAAAMFAFGATRLWRRYRAVAWDA
jgi:O-antigen/teichoic acid export membrane protein